MAIRRMLAIWLPLVHCSCDMQASREAYFVRDSAGVRIVENGTPAWVGDQGWAPSVEPVLDFGPDDALHQIGSVLRLESGRIVVAHGSAREIVIYSASGTLEKRFGAFGAGPGEFRELSRVFASGAGDTLVAFDAVLRRASVFDTTGKVVRSFAPNPIPDGNPSFVAGAFGDGSLLLASGAAFTPETRGLVRPILRLWRAHSAGVGVGLIAELPGEERFFQDSPFGPVDMRRPFFGFSAAYYPWRDLLYWGATDTFEIRISSRDGVLQSVIRKRHAYQRVEQRDTDVLIEQQLATIEDAGVRVQVRGVLGNLPVGLRAPAFGWPQGARRYGPELQVDQEGNIWIVEYFMPGATSRNARTVIDSTGRWLGSVELPPRFAPTQIGRDFLLGTWTDSSDTEHIRLYGLVKKND